MAQIHMGDWFILFSYLLIIFIVAWVKSRNEESIDDFVIGGRNIPGWAVLASIIATEISAVTFLNVPGVAFTGDLAYLQFGIGSLAGRFVVAYLFLTAFYKHRYLTVYSYLEDRFGPHTRYAATFLFLISRLLGSSIRLSLAAFGISIVLALPFTPVLLAFTVLACLYTFWGGIKAIIWTDLIQASVFIGSGLTLASWFGYQIGWNDIWTSAAHAGKTNLFNWIPDNGFSFIALFTQADLFFLAFINGFIVIIAALGTDQDLTQRMLTCRSLRPAQKSVIWSGFIGIPVAALFLFLGLAMFRYAQLNHHWILPLDLDGHVDANRIFPDFITNIAPPYLKGFLITGTFAAAMSSIDSAMGALSSSATVDLFKPIFKPNESQAYYLKTSRFFVLFFALILFTLAIVFKDAGTYLWLALQIASIPAGTMLGIFLLGLLTQRGNDFINLIAMGTSLTITTTLFIGIKLDHITLSWTWIVLIGVLITFAIGVSQKQTSDE